jgi:TnpA family transposase
MQQIWALRKWQSPAPVTSLSKLSWLVAWHIRDEPYSKALAEIVNYQHRILFATHWGEGKTLSSDSQRYRAGGRGEAGGQVNLKYGKRPRSYLLYSRFRPIRAISYQGH